MNSELTALVALFAATSASAEPLFIDRAADLLLANSASEYDLGECPLLSRKRTFAYRTHLGLAKDTPVGRAVQYIGRVTALPHLGGLHHVYVRM